MLRRFNFTGRKRINKSSVNISLVEENQIYVTFNATIDLDSLNLSEDAKIFVDAYFRMMQSQRYSFGTVGRLTQPEDSSLGLLGYAQSLKFRVYVVDKKGKIIALAEEISIKRDPDKKTLLPVDIRNLDNLLWNINTTGHQGAPVLELNERIDGIKNVAAFDPRFIHSVYPAVVREIMMHLAYKDKIDFSSPDFDWQQNWLTFAERIYTSPPEGTVQNSEDLILVWIDGVVRAFTKARRKDWQDHRLKEWSTHD